jgi:hypothetical protein
LQALVADRNFTKPSRYLVLFSPRRFGYHRAVIHRPAMAFLARRQRQTTAASALAALLALAACADLSDAIWPPVEAPPSVVAPATAAPPTASATNAAALGAAVAQSVSAELLAQANVYRRHADATIERLVARPRASDAELRAQWGRAATELDLLAAQLARLSAGGAGPLVDGGQVLLACERDRLTALGRAISGSAERAASFAQPPKAPAPPSGRPFITIRFDRPSPAYEDVLFRATREAAARKPDVAFDLSAAPAAGASSEQSALAALAADCQTDKIRRSLIEMGFAPDRLTIAPPTTAATAANEVRVYLR